MRRALAVLAVVLALLAGAGARAAGAPAQQGDSTPLSDEVKGLGGSG